MAEHPPSVALLDNLFHVCLRDRIRPDQQLRLAHQSAKAVMNHDVQWFDNHYHQQQPEIDTVHLFLGRMYRYLRMLSGEENNDTGQEMANMQQLEAQMNVDQHGAQLMQTLNAIGQDAPDLNAHHQVAQHQQNLFGVLAHTRRTRCKRVVDLQCEFAAIATICHLRPTEQQRPVGQYVEAFLTESDAMSDQLYYHNVVFAGLADAFAIIARSVVPPPPHQPNEPNEAK